MSLSHRIASRSTQVSLAIKDLSRLSFLDLPKEVRLIVYEHLLRYRNIDLSCILLANKASALLRVSKLIKNEVEPVQFHDAILRSTLNRNYIHLISEAARPQLIEFHAFKFQNFPDVSKFPKLKQILLMLWGIGHPISPDRAGQSLLVFDERKVVNEAEQDLFQKLHEDAHKADPSADADGTEQDDFKGFVKGVIEKRPDVKILLGYRYRVQVGERKVRFSQPADLAKY